jgi:hypothetical protein
MLNLRVARNVVIFIVLLLLIIPSMSFGEEITSPKKLILKRSLFDEVFFAGRWSIIADTSSGILLHIPKINTVEGFCYKETKTCKESLALFYGPDESDKMPFTKNGNLVTDFHEYRIIEWTSTTIYARAEYDIADIELRISLPDKRIERIYRETKARGSKVSNPDILYHWILK